MPFSGVKSEKRHNINITVRLKVKFVKNILFNTFVLALHKIKIFFSI